MKKVAILLLVTIIDSVGLAERVTVDYHVVNDLGVPVKNAKVTTWTEKNSIIQSWYSSAEYDDYIRKTNGAGDARCTFGCHNGDFQALVEAEGHYPVQMSMQSFRTDYDFATKSTKFFEKKKQLNITLFRKINPVPMNSYLGNMRWIQFLTNTWNNCGYDLQLHDWLPPNGHGKVADLYVSHEATIEGDILYSHGHISFDDKCGGYIVKSKREDKKLLVYSADTNANYVTSFIAERKKRINKEVLEQQQILGEGEALVMRTRVKTDSQGNIISCRYSKIYGPFSAAGVFKFKQSSYNPEDGSTNLEFDVRSNLSKSPWFGFIP